MQLQAGITYNFSGGWRVATLHPFSCDDPLCEDGESCSPVVFPEPSVAVTPGTWGLVKGLYR